MILDKVDWPSSALLFDPVIVILQVQNKLLQTRSKAVLLIQHISISVHSVLFARPHCLGRLRLALKRNFRCYNIIMYFSCWFFLLLFYVKFDDILTYKWRYIAVKAVLRIRLTYQRIPMPNISCRSTEGSLKFKVRKHDKFRSKWSEH